MRRLNVSDLLSFEVLVTNLIEHDLAYLGVLFITVVCLYPEKELFGRLMVFDLPFFPLPLTIPISGLIVYLVDQLFTFVFINCHELPLLRITISSHIT